MIKKLIHFFVKAEIKMADWKARNGLTILRISLGLVFIWFGVLKFFPGLSPAEDIAGRTIEKLTLGLVKPAAALPLLAVWECTIGLGFILKRWLSLTLVLLYFQMMGTFLPLVFFPHETFTHIFVPTLLGQYIIKNIVLLSGGLLISVTSQGGVLTSYSKVEAKTPRFKRVYRHHKKKAKMAVEV
jgi:uncharacterized membrane protein YkgB